VTISALYDIREAQARHRLMASGGGAQLPLWSALAQAVIAIGMRFLTSSFDVLGRVHPRRPGSRTLSLFKYTFISRAWPSWARYFATVLIVCAMLSLRLALGDLFQGYPFLFFFLAILASSALFNRGSGILAVLLSAVLAKWFLMPPTGTLSIATTADVIALSSFIAVGLLSAAVLEALHRVASDLVEANQKLVASESEKDLLLQEASHRFKNELAMLDAMLRLQERDIAEPAASAALRSAAERVHVLGRMHERLQRANQEAVVHMREFLNALCEDVRSARIGHRPISLKVNVEDHLLPQERAVPVGLILNELLTNAFKYAFPDDRRGTIKVGFRKEAESYLLAVADDGVGMNSRPASEQNGTGLGQRLIRSMVGQLDGILKVEPSATGSALSIRFPAA
jgi:two-component system, sensor histidine kinase PdtaS